MLEKYLGQIERELIERALERGQGKQNPGRPIAGHDPAAVYRRLVQLGMIEV